MNPETPSVKSVKSVDFSPKVSVIVPVYKVEKYLPECIESVLAQTFPDFELLLVDDGSPDNSGKICDDYAARDPRIRVFHKENGGVSSARNLGLDNARGEWIAFVDSDDTVGEKYLEHLWAQVRENAMLDFVFCRLWLDSNGVLREVPQHATGTLSSAAVLVSLLSGELNGGPYCKFFRSRIIADSRLRFCEEISIFEDLLFLVQYAKRIRAGRGVDAVLYRYIQHDGSAMHRFSARLSRDRIRAMDLLEAEIDGNETLLRELRRRKNGVKFSAIRSMTLPHEELQQTWKDLPICGVPLAKHIILKIYATPIWFTVMPLLALRQPRLAWTALKETLEYKSRRAIANGGGV